MPLPITLMGLPWYVPVKPYIPRTPVTLRGFSKKVLAMNSARNGSPGIRTVLAKSPFWALLCGVGTVTSLLLWFGIYYQYSTIYRF